MITIMLINIRSIRSKTAELVGRLEVIKPDILCITETWLDSSSAHFVLPGYDFNSRRDRDDGRIGGGVAAYVRSGLGILCHSVSSDSAE